MNVQLPPLPPDGPVVAHEPVPDRPLQPTRRPMMFWDRSKLIILLFVYLGFCIALKHNDVPIMSWGEAIRDQTSAKTWIFVVAGIELLRQIHYLVSERKASYHQFWQRRVWRAWERRMSHLNPWLRYRLARVVRIVVWLSLIMLVFSAVWGVSFIEAIAQAPGRMWSNPFGAHQPWFFQIAFGMFYVVIQFAAIFWFMSRGGVDTYMPDEVATRFDNVWGQDHVVQKVRENLVFLERPEEIESKGGHVPGGILLWGPPGTGKTLLAEAVAGETGRPYVFVDPGAFQNMFMGVGILKVKSLFKKLRKLALRYGGVIVFFDEADSLGSRGGAVAYEHGVAHGHADGSTCHASSYLSRPAVGMLDERVSRLEAGANDSSRLRKFVMGGMGGGGGGMGTLQALLTELSGLSKPRGFVNRRIRHFLGIKSKPPPKYRILTIMATNMPDSLDPALLRPGRIDRIYKVGYPSKEGRRRTFEGYFNRVKHNVPAEQMEKLATISEGATGATIKDLVNESLIVAIRNERDYVIWSDVVEARKLKMVGPGENVEYIERERHAIAIHEACHAVMAYRVQKGHTIDIATIEKGQDFLGFVLPIPIEEQFTHWRTDREADILVSLASLAGERLFFDGDNSSGVSGDLRSATRMAALMDGYWGMGDTVGSHAFAKTHVSGISASMEDGTDRNFLETNLGRRVETRLARLLDMATDILIANRREVLAVAHALETFKTITGDDIAAIINGCQGPLVDGRPYVTHGFAAEVEAYHIVAAAAHREQGAIDGRLPNSIPLVAARPGPPVMAPWAPPKPFSSD